MRYVNLGYAVTLVTLAAYSWRVLRRSRTLTRALAPDDGERR